MAHSSNSSRNVNVEYDDNQLGEQPHLDRTENDTSKQPQNYASKKPHAPHDSLNRINESFHQTKAEQILRLLKDQETLNAVFDKCAAKESVQEDEDYSDNSLTADSMKDTERRLSMRMSLHKQRGGGCKTSMGFNNDNDVLSSDDEDTEMVYQERQINTLKNRPKSSYIRRTSAMSNYGDCDYGNDHADRSRKTLVRPKSRLGCRGESSSRGDNCGRQRRAVLRETSFNNNHVFDEDDGAQCVDDLIEVKNYDNYASTKYAQTGQTGLTRQRSNLKLKVYGEDGDMAVSSSRDYSSPMSTNCQTNSEQENIVEIQQSSSKQRHRRQQLRSARENRPSSENLFFVRQRTETSGFVRGSTTNPSVRPKSDKLLLNVSGNRNRLSIDSNPNQGSQLPKSYEVPDPDTGVTSHERLSTTYGAAPQHGSRPISRRSSMRADIPCPIRGQTKNVAVYGTRGQPISLMKLPPLDPAVAQRAAERALVIPATRETCA